MLIVYQRLSLNYLHERQPASQILCSSPTWWLWRSGCTRSHSELGRETLQRQWYFVLRHGRVGRCQVCQEHKSNHLLKYIQNTHSAGWSSPVARQAHNLKAAGSNPAPATKFPQKYTKSLKHNRCSYLCELAPASRRRSFDLISMHGSEFYTHAPQRAHNPKGGQQDASVILNPPELHGVTPVDVLARVRLMSVASRYSGCRAVQIKVA